MNYEEFKTPLWDKRGRSVTERPFRAYKVPLPRTRPTELKGRIILDIGCGQGEHAFQLAQRQGRAHVYAIEHTKERFGKMLRAFQKNPLPNLHPIHANAISWVAYFLAPETVEHIFLLYPNPYLRPKDWGRRWYATPFWATLGCILKEGGTLTLATNIKHYAELCLYFHHEHWRKKLPRLNLQDEGLYGGPPRTLFEKKYQQRSQACYRLVFVKGKTGI